MPATSVVLAEPRGFCAGVEMAIKALTWMVRVFEPPVYCYHEIVHNQWVVRMFEDAGVVFVDEIDEVPQGAPVMLSAHGSAPEVVAGAQAQAGIVIDAVCPLVTKVHHEVKRAAEKGFDIIYVGHEGHDEAIGTMAVAPDAITLVEPEWDLDRFRPDNPEKVTLLAQTTLGKYEWESVLDQAQERYPALATPRRSDLCYATTNRQSAVAALARECDVILVVGSESSSNTKALVRVSNEHGVPAYRIDHAAAIDPAWLDGAVTVGVTAGASAPDHLVQEVIDRVDPTEGVRLLRVTEEDEYFPLPPQLRHLLRALEALVRAGFGASEPEGPGLLERDTEWTATEALGELAAPGSALGA
ncbi:MAG: 4-hydroxy-3-methylbut-2-enyl diphosphate reductase [Acidimicrobiia bacterium]|nr:MAG: 4-hydroxy-3-methylbut-2-enyl diphosphate reductase [Acidimicrobiia bacterium]